MTTNDAAVTRLGAERVSDAPGLGRVRRQGCPVPHRHRCCWLRRAIRASGEQGIGDILADVEHLLPAAATVLEIGCGVGRPLGRRFASIYGMNVSTEMISRARTRHDDLGNVTVRLTDGITLRPVESGTIDLAVSYLVFQHIPEASVVEANIRDAFRVLKPGGLFKFQVTGRPDTEEAGYAERGPAKDTWCGVRGSDSEIREMGERAGFTVRSTYSHTPPDSCISLWLIAEKPRRCWAPRTLGGRALPSRVGAATLGGGPSS